MFNPTLNSKVNSWGGESWLCVIVCGRCICLVACCLPSPSPNFQMSNPNCISMNNRLNSSRVLQPGRFGTKLTASRAGRSVRQSELTTLWASRAPAAGGWEASRGHSVKLIAGKVISITVWPQLLTRTKQIGDWSQMNNIKPEITSTCCVLPW